MCELAPENKDKSAWKQHVWVLLNHIEGPVNLGFISRAMANTGFRQLRFHGTVHHDDEEALRYAVHSHGVLQASCKVRDLDELCQGLDVIIGLSPRQPWNDGCDISLDELPTIVEAAIGRQQQVGLLFGNEAHGLDNKALSTCRYRLALPTDPSYISMNLAQAVLVTLWELHCHHHDPARLPKHPLLAPPRQIEQLLLNLRQYLEEIEYLDPQNPEHLWQELSIMIRKRDWSERELTLLLGMVRTSRKRLRAGNFSAMG